MFNLSGTEIVFILLAALVLLGPEKLPDTLRKVGRVYAEVRKISNGFQSELRNAINEPTKEIRDAFEQPAKEIKNTAEQARSAFSLRQVGGTPSGGAAPASTPTGSGAAAPTSSPVPSEPITDAFGALPSSPATGDAAEDRA